MRRLVVGIPCASLGLGLALIAWQGSHALPGPTATLAGARSVPGDSPAQELPATQEPPRDSHAPAASRRIVGSVTDSHGLPVAGAQVALLSPRSPEAVRTDASGSYALSGVPAGRSVLLVQHESFRPWPGTVIHLAPDERGRRVDVVLETGCTLGGRVRDESDASISGAAVVASNEVARMVHTDAEGRFLIRGLGRQEVTLTVTAPGFGPARLRGIDPELQGLDIPLTRGGSVTGRVTADILPEAFTVFLVGSVPDLGAVRRVRAETFTSDGKGEFAVRDVGPGRFSVEVEADGFQAVDYPWVDVASGRATRTGEIRLRRIR